MVAHATPATRHFGPVDKPASARDYTPGRLHRLLAAAGFRVTASRLSYFYSPIAPLAFNRLAGTLGVLFPSGLKMLSGMSGLVPGRWRGQLFVIAECTD